MSEQTIDLKKRRFLTKATGVVGAVGVGFVAWPSYQLGSPPPKLKRQEPPLMSTFQSLSQASLFAFYGEKSLFGFLKETSPL